MYLGSFGIDDYVGIPAATHRFSSGAAYAPTVLTYSIYEEGGTTGIDEDVDMVVAAPFDSVVGCYWIRRQLTAAAGFEAGKNYLVVVKATVDSVAAIQMHTFQVEARVRSNLVAILGTALTETAGLLAGAFKKFFNVATPTGTVNSIPDAVAGAASGLAIVGSVMGKSAATLAAGDVSGNLPADLKAITVGVDLSAAMKASVNAEVDTALDTAIPGSPTSDSINERVKAIDTKLPSKSYLAGSNNSDGDVQMDEATGNFPGTVAKSATTLAAGDVSGNLPVDLKAITTGVDLSAVMKTSVEAAATAALIPMQADVDDIQLLVGEVPTDTENADALLKRDMSAVSGEASRSPLNALRVLRNKTDTHTVPGVLLVMKEDDAAEAWRGALVFDASAEPITEVDPV